MAEPVLERLIIAVGIDSAFLLVRKRGGERIYIPSREISGGHWLAELLGPEAAARLVEAYGGESVDIPRLNPHDLRARDMEICRRAAGGEKARALAREYGVSTRWVRRIVKLGGSSSP